MSKENISMSPKETYCSGCGACISICPVGAISLELNRAGFYEAVVDENKCVHCGKCCSVCLRFQQFEGVSLYNAEHYAMQSTDKDIIKTCSSGGLAYELSLLAVNKNKTVVGCAYDNQDGHARHVCVSDKVSLEQLKGSKYLQSDVTKAFAEAVDAAIKEKDKQFVVFGTPCQIAGMAKVTQQLDIRERFLLVEIFCHGVSSYHVWDKQLKTIEKKLGKEPEEVQFRYKKDDWHSYCIKASNGEKDWFGTREKAEFWHVFFENVLLNDACMVCQSRREHSLADIRLGDYWGYRFENHSDGVSAVFAMTQAGKEAINDLIEAGRVTELEAGDVKEMLAAQNMSGYKIDEKHKMAIEALKNGEDVSKVVRDYRKKQSGKQKLKRSLLLLSGYIPSGIRAKLRKKNSSRYVKKNVNK